jgi:hypothetical protein
LALVKRPPETVGRTIQLDQPVSELLDDYRRFVGCSPDYVTNFTLRKTLSRDPDYKKWKAARNGPPPAKSGIAESPAQKPS